MDMEKPTRILSVRKKRINGNPTRLFFCDDGYEYTLVDLAFVVGISASTLTKRMIKWGETHELVLYEGSIDRQLASKHRPIPTEKRRYLVTRSGDCVGNSRFEDTLIPLPKLNPPKNPHRLDKPYKVTPFLYLDKETVLECTRILREFNQKRLSIFRDKEWYRWKREKKLYESV